MTDTSDRRMWSITARGLSALVGDLTRLGIFSSSARQLQKTFRQRQIYPARDFAHRCQPLPPDAFFTYHSAQNYVDLQEIVWRAFDFAAKLLRERRPDLAAEDLEPMIAAGIRLWVDFVFIDQSSRDIRRELDVLAPLLHGSTAHFVLGEQPLARAWCCYEIAQFNQRGTAAAPGDLPLRSFIAPTTKIYFNWELTETSDADDKAFIKDHIDNHFPHGFAGFEAVMQQANLTAVLSQTERYHYYSPAAIESLAQAAENWYARGLPT